MPELPEVEVVRRGVHDAVVGRTIAAVAVTHPRAVRRHAAGAEDFTTALAGRRVEGTARRGKYLWLTLSSSSTEPAAPALLAHLGMSGQLLMRPPGAVAETHLRVRVGFADTGPELRFVDQRTFGGLAVTGLVPDGQQVAATGPHPDEHVLVPAPIVHIAADPLEPAFDEARFLTAVRRRRTGLKRALLDQGLISGIGNIYADEALWAARLHYARPTETSSRPALRSLLACVREVLTAALAQGGTSFDALYVNVNGQSGYFDRSLAVYGREGKPCRRCGTAIRRESFMNRSSFLCPTCQPRPRRARW